MSDVVLRELGRSGLKIAPLVLGGNVFGWTADERASHAVLDAAVAAGINMIDTADAYSAWVPGHKGGESETVIGSWLKKSGKRGQVLIATKVGHEMAPGRGGLSRAHILRSIDESLRRLQTDHVDLYQAHIDDAKVPLEETLGAFDELVKSGKVRALGASNHGAARLAQALEVSHRNGWARYESLQPWYNLHDRADFEGEVQERCQRENVGVICYFALASGFLTGKYRSEADLAGRPRAMAVKGNLNARGLRILAALDAVAARHDATPAQVALAWIVAHGVTAPIASATTVPQLQEIAGSMRLRLDADSVRELDAASVGSEPRRPPG
ncbi:MAG: aldo/keto reductase [Steroidobacteraceae bacterium]